MAIKILGPLRKSRCCFRYIVVIADCFHRLVRVMLSRHIHPVDGAQSLLERWAQKYKPPKTFLSDNGNKFTSKSFQSVCQQIKSTNVFTFTHHPQTNARIKRYNWSLTSMLRFYINDHQQICISSAPTLTYAYISQAHHFTDTCFFHSHNMVLNRKIPNFILKSNVSTKKLLTNA